MDRSAFDLLPVWIENPGGSGVLIEWKREEVLRVDIRHPRHPALDRRYASLGSGELPLTESLKDTVARFLPYWHGTIAPKITSGARVLIAAHGNSLRALVKYLDNVSDDAIVELNIPTGIPLVYELDAHLKPIRSYYLGDQEAAQRAAAAVAKQGTRG